MDRICDKIIFHIYQRQAAAPVSFLKIAVCSELGAGLLSFFFVYMFIRTSSSNSRVHEHSFSD